MGSLAVYGKATTVTQPAIAGDIHEAFDIELDLFSKIAFDTSLCIKDGADAIDLFFGKVTDLPVDINVCFRKNLIGASSADTVDIRQTDLSALLWREIHAGNTSHLLPPLTLSLLMLGIYADDANDTPPMNHFALIADFFD
jgi:hypothetical protein